MIENMAIGFPDSLVREASLDGHYEASACLDFCILALRSSRQIIPKMLRRSFLALEVCYSNAWFNIDLGLAPVCPCSPELPFSANPCGRRHPEIPGRNAKVSRTRLSGKRWSSITSP